MNNRAALQSGKRDDRTPYPFRLPMTPLDWTWDHPAGSRDGAPDKRNHTSAVQGGRASDSRKPLSH